MCAIDEDDIVIPIKLETYFKNCSGMLNLGSLIELQNFKTAFYQFWVWRK